MFTLLHFQLLNAFLVMSEVETGKEADNTNKGSMILELWAQHGAEQPERDTSGEGYRSVLKGTQTNKHKSIATITTNLVLKTYFGHLF